MNGGEKDRSWPGTLMAVGVVLTVVNVFTVARWTLVRPDELLRALALLCFVGNLLPYRAVAGRLGMARLEWFLFNLLAVGPLLMGLLLWANLLFHGRPAATVHRIDEVGPGAGFHMHTFADGLWEAYPLARLLPREQAGRPGHELRIATANGLLGVPVVVDVAPLRQEVDPAW
ncbi:MAG: hypothetical protein RBT71_14355 [Flavobacteriales bacterium]|nr:hypothetical protein [Flavobacteriales bacterium]